MSTPCSVVASTSCIAPANSTMSTRGRCFACGEPVCLDPWCSRIRTWGRCGRRRVCRNCDGHNGLHADPVALDAYDRRLLLADRSRR